MNVLVLLEQLDEQIDTAKAVPMTGQALIDRDAAFGLLDEVRTAMPGEITEARTILAERQRILDEARAQASEMLAGAQAAASAAWGFDALDARLQEIAGTVERATRDPHADSPLTAATMDQVTPILTEAEAAASRIVSDARRHAEQLLRDAERDAAQRREQTAAAASRYLAEVEEATAPILSRAGQIGVHIDTLLERVRAGGDGLAQTLTDETKTVQAELRDIETQLSTLGTPAYQSPITVEMAVLPDDPSQQDDREPELDGAPAGSDAPAESPAERTQ